MSYKCAIFGHKYGDAEVERDREEDGNEVIITVREKETCARCGETRIVSENKEVTTLETAADIVADDLVDDTDDDSEESPAGQREGTTDEISGATEQGAQSPQETAKTAEIPEAESEVPDEAVDPETDDGVILDEDDDDEADDEDEGREPGQWPEEADDDEDQDQTETDWSEERTDNGEENWKHSPEIEPHPETDQTVTTSTSDALTVPEGSFYCRECDFTTPVESSSLRAGDFCPECHKATLEHRRD